MSQPNERIWILLVQKSPKGPFTLAEVNTLLDKGIVRRNDLALKIQPKEAGLDGKKVGGNWRILWQYPEFDRRQEEPSAMTEVSAMFPSREGERRKAADELAKSTQIQELLPEELGEIQPEDLIGKTTREIRQEESGSTAAELSFNSDSVRPDEGDRSAPKWIYALILISVGGAGYSWFTRPDTSVAKKITAKAADGVVTGGSSEDVPPINRGVSSAVKRNFVPAFRRPAPGSAPPPSQAADSPTRQTPEPNRYEESQLDRPERLEGDRGEIAAEDRDENKEPTSDEALGIAGNKSTPVGRPARKARAAISEEDGSPEGGGNEPNAVQESLPATEDASSPENGGGE